MEEPNKAKVSFYEIKGYNRNWDELLSGSYKLRERHGNEEIQSAGVNYNYSQII